MKVFDLFSSSVHRDKWYSSHSVYQHMTAMALGFRQFGFKIRDNNNVVGSNDIGLMFGYTRGKGKGSSTRDKIISNQKNNKSPLLCFDSPVFSTWHRKKFPDHIGYRYGINSPSGTGEWFKEDRPMDRWNMFKKLFDIQERPWQTDGYILFCMDADRGGWLYDESYSYDKWINRKLIKLKKHTDRKIILRPHPRNNTNVIALSKKFNCEIDTIPNMQDSLMNAYACVTHSSSATIESTILGVHTFIDSNHVLNPEVCDTDISNIETPTNFDRCSFFAGISYTTWLFDELKYKAPKHYLEGLKMI